MSLANTLKDRVTVQLRVATQTAMGETVVWIPIEKRYARVIPLDARARAVYQQMNSEVTHKVVLRNTPSISLSLGNNRILWKDKSLEPVGPPQNLGNETVIMVKEV